MIRFLIDYFNFSLFQMILNPLDIKLVKLIILLEDFK